MGVWIVYETSENRVICSCSSESACLALVEHFRYMDDMTLDYIYFSRVPNILIELGG